MPKKRIAVLRQVLSTSDIFK